MPCKIDLRKTFGLNLLSGLVSIRIEIYFMKILFIYPFLFFCVGLLKAQPIKNVYKKIGTTTIYKSDSLGLYWFTAGFMIDADGAPKAYHRNNKIALDYRGNGGEPGNWWALVTDNQKKSGNPVIQKSSDPAPGYYISMTSLENTKKIVTDPARYVNSEEIPYIAMPVGFSKDFMLGDIALVYNKKSGRKCFVIFADRGPANKIGEGSIKLAKELGINSSPKTGGVESGITYVLIPGSGKNTLLNPEQIDSIGNSKLSASTIVWLLK